MLQHPFLCVVLGCALLVGCTSTAEKAARSAAITEQGEASIENFVEKGLTTTRIFVMKIDEVLVQPKGMKGVYPLAAGHHDISVTAHWGRSSITGLYIDAGETTLSFVAAAATRYRLRGEKLSQSAARIWVEDANTARSVAEARIDLAPNRQDVPPFVIPLPAAK
jgi:hypothetical protein